LFHYFIARFSAYFLLNTEVSNLARRGKAIKRKKLLSEGSACFFNPLAVLSLFHFMRRCAKFGMSGKQQIMGN
jgi:hypothetical protein